MIRLNAIPTMIAMIRSVMRGVGLRDLDRIKKITRQSFPFVRQISTEQLATWMETSNQSLLIVDVRSADEFAISRLRGAVNLTTAQQITEAIHSRKPFTAILYCSVGFRSSRLADELARRGIADVANLEGSIFQWANEGRPLYRDETLVKQVHPYGKRWAGLLRPGLAKLIM